MIEQKATGVSITVVAQPKSSKNEVVGPFNGAIKIKIMAPPIEGRANEAIIEFLSELFRIPKRQIHLEKGDTSKHKRFLIEGITLELAKEKLKATS